MGEPERRCVVCQAVYAGGERFCSSDGGAIVAVGGDPGDPYIGKTFDDRYLVTRLIGHGGMGAVYEADHVGLDRRIAIKFMRGEADPDAIARFRTEARAASRIVHPHVVQIFDVGSDAGIEFIAMELLDGRDLRETLAAGPLDLQRALAIARQILDGLGAIHAAGIVHRDIKPANVLLTVDGDDHDVVKITDFGISKVLDARTSGLTAVGKVVGTPRYMSPEQLCGGELDQRSDLYAVGLTLHEMLAGTPPFTGSSSTIVQQHLEVPAPSLDDLRPGLPRAVVAAVARALAKDPADRFVDARAFAEALGGSPLSGARRDQADTVRASKPRPRNELAEVAAPSTPRAGARTRGPWRWVVLVGISVVLAGVLSAFVISRVWGDRFLGSGQPRDAASEPSPVAQHLAYARAAEAEGKLELAIAGYEAADQLEPSAQAMMRIAGLYEQLGRFDDARVYLTRYLDRAPDAPDREVVQARLAALSQSVPAPPSDAAPPDRPLPTPGRRTSGPRPELRSCQCITRKGPSFQPLCKQLHPAKCECRGRLTMCREPLVRCDASTGCGDSGDYDGYTCREGLGAPTWTGSTGDPCQGYSSDHRATEPLDGHLACNRCAGSPTFEYRGVHDAPCTGYHALDGAVYQGNLVYCDGDR